MISVTLGKPSAADSPVEFHDSVWTGLPILLLMALVLMLGLYNPPELTVLMNEATAFLNPKPQ